MKNQTTICIKIDIDLDFQHRNDRYNRETLKRRNDRYDREDLKREGLAFVFYICYFVIFPPDSDALFIEPAPSSNGLY